MQRIVDQTDATVRHADLTVVSNDRDADALVNNGADRNRIAILPLGLTPLRLNQFAAVRMPSRTNRSSGSSVRLIRVRECASSPPWSIEYPARCLG